MSETDEQFVERIRKLKIWDGLLDETVSRLFALARRGAASADRIEQLEAEVLTWQGHAKTAIWGDSEECKSLSAEVDRLVRSRNKWGQRYNKLLLKIRAGESGETDDPASWQLRMALDDVNVKNDEAAARIEQLEAALRLAQRGLDPYATYETQLEARVVADGICAALEKEERT